MNYRDKILDNQWTKLSYVVKSNEQAASVSSENACFLSAFLGRKERARLTEDYLSSSVFLKDKLVL